MRGLDVGDVKAPFQYQRVIAVELDGIGAGFGKDQPDKVKVQLDDHVNIGKFDVALDLGHDVVALIVDDP